jgi:hypothetical protein
MLTKKLQARIWEHQPVGAHSWRVRTLNVHDEPVCAHIPSLKETIKKTVVSFIEEYRSVVPLLSMEWKQDVSGWEGVK